MALVEAQSGCCRSQAVGFRSRSERDSSPDHVGAHPFARKPKASGDLTNRKAVIPIQFPDRFRIDAEHGEAARAVSTFVPTSSVRQRHKLGATPDGDALSLHRVDDRVRVHSDHGCDLSSGEFLIPVETAKFRSIDVQRSTPVRAEGRNSAHMFDDAFEYLALYDRTSGQFCSDNQTRSSVADLPSVDRLRSERKGSTRCDASAANKVADFFEDIAVGVDDRQTPVSISPHAGCALTVEEPCDVIPSQFAQCTPSSALRRPS